MNDQRARELFLDHHRGSLPAADAAALRAHLDAHPELQAEFAELARTLDALDAMPTPKPSLRLRKNFYAMLEEEKHSDAPSPAATAHAAPVHRPGFWRWAFSSLVACALLVLGFLAGKQAPDSSTKQEIALLREQVNQQNAQLNAQLNKMTTVVTWSVLQQQNPANERFQEVLAAAKTAPTEKTVENLISALMLDPNINVRLRAIEALYPLAEREVVRAGVLAALPREQNALVQLEMIDFVAAMQDRNALPVLEKLSADESIERAVRDAARLAIAQL
jgi:hypothetical protein